MLKVVGEGRDVTTLETRNRALLGGGYPAETAAKLVVENARVNWGAGSRTATFCHDVPADRPSPEICLTNAMLWSDSPLLGYYAYGNNAMVKLSMKDSEYYGHYNSRVGSGTVGVMIDADNSQMHSDGQVGWAINAKTIQADFHGADAEFGSFDKTQTADNSNGGRFVAAGNTTGLIQLREGARMKTTRGIVFNNSEIAVVFDGGIFEIVPHNTLLNTTSTWTNVQGGFTTQGSGLTVDICEGSTHALNFPVKGTGKVVKTGEGTFELVSARAEGEKLLQYTGGTVVSNGTFVIDGSLVADGAKSFEVLEGAILDLNGSTLAGATISGAGVVTNGTLSAARRNADCRLRQDRRGSARQDCGEGRNRRRALHWRSAGQSQGQVRQHGHRARQDRRRLRGWRRNREDDPVWLLRDHPLTTDRRGETTARQMCRAVVVWYTACNIGKETVAQFSR